jgi:hypothetical protein
MSLLFLPECWEDKKTPPPLPFRRSHVLRDGAPHLRAAAAAAVVVVAVVIFA